MLGILLFLPVAGNADEEYTLDWWSVDSGAAEPGEVNDYTLHGAVGQSDAAAPVTDPSTANLDGGFLALPYGTTSQTATWFTFQWYDHTKREETTNGTYTLLVERRGSGVGNVSVDVWSQDGDATAGSDYTSLSQTLTWLNGDLEPKTVSVEILADTQIEVDEELVLILGNPLGPYETTLGRFSRVPVIILDDDRPTIDPRFLHDDANLRLHAKIRYDPSTDKIETDLVWNDAAATGSTGNYTLTRRKRGSTVPITLRDGNGGRSFTDDSESLLENDSEYIYRVIGGGGQASNDILVHAYFAEPGDSP